MPLLVFKKIRDLQWGERDDAEESCSLFYYKKEVCVLNWNWIKKEEVYMYMYKLEFFVFDRSKDIDMYGLS